MPQRGFLHIPSERSTSKRSFCELAVRGIKAVSRKAKRKSPRHSRKSGLGFQHLRASVQSPLLLANRCPQRQPLFARTEVQPGGTMPFQVAICKLPLQSSSSGQPAREPTFDLLLLRSAKVKDDRGTILFGKRGLFISLNQTKVLC